MPSKHQLFAADQPAVGRSPELAAVIRCLTESRQVDPRCILVRGARGSGRSRFLADVASGRTEAAPRDGVAWHPVTFIDDLDLEPAADRDLLLRSLADRPDRPDVVVSIGSGPPFGRGVQVLAARGWDVWLVDLKGLNPADVALWLGRDRVDAQAQAWYQASGGNPALLTAALSGAPAAAARVVGSWTERLSAPDLLVVQAAAVAGPRFDLDVVAAAANVSIDEAVRGIDALVAAEWFEVHESVPRFGFRHPMVVEQLCSSADRLWLRRAHGRVADVLSHASASGAGLARHVSGRAIVGDEAATAELFDMLATAEASAVNPAPVLQALAALLAPTDPRSRDVALHLAEVAAAQGDLGLWRRIIRSVFDDDPGGVPTATIAGYIELELLLGEQAHGGAVADEALRHAGPPTSPAYQRLLAARASGVVYAGLSFGDARVLAEAASSSIGPSAEPAVLASMAGIVAWTASLAGDEDLEALVDAAVRSFDDLDDDQIADGLLGALSAVQAALSGQRLAAGEAMALRVRDVAVRTGQAHVLACVDITVARCQLFQGQLEPASSRLSDAVGSLRMADGGVQLAFSRAALAYVDALQGDNDGARRGVAETLALLIEEAPSLMRSGALIFAAHTLGAVGAPARAADAVLEAGGGSGLSFLPAVDRAYGYEMLTSAAIDAGELGLARRWVERAHAAGGGLMATAAAERAAANLAAAEGDHRSAQVAARRARDASDSAGGRLEAARARLLEGLARSASGERELAVVELLWVHRTCSELGAVNVGAVASRQLRRLGRRAPVLNERRSLSDREAEVGALVASGLTNREIAASLFISERTVESHVANVLAKLGLRTRAAVAATLASSRGKDLAQEGEPGSLPLPGPGVGVLRRLSPSDPGEPPSAGPASELLGLRRLANTFDSASDVDLDRQASALTQSASAGDPLAIAAAAAAADRADQRGDQSEIVRWRAVVVSLLASAQPSEQARARAGWSAARDQALGESAAGLPTVSGRPGDRYGPILGLTPRQSEVARLVAAGLTNRQVGEWLSITEKTVEGHVSRSLERLGLRSRMGIGAALRAAGGTP